MKNVSKLVPVLTSIYIASLVVLILAYIITTKWKISLHMLGIGGATGTFIITTVSLIYYFLMYYVGVVLGTARFARSSVLFANKLPISELL